MDLCRCKKAEASTKVSFEKFGSITVCAECSAEWNSMKMYFWNQFIDPPKYRDPVGLNAAQIYARGKLV